MSDFLSNLALRSIQPAANHAPVLQPRLPALFEAPSALGLAGGIAEGSENFEARSAVREVAVGREDTPREQPQAGEERSLREQPEPESSAANLRRAKTISVEVGSLRSERAISLARDASGWEEGSERAPLIGQRIPVEAAVKPEPAAGFHQAASALTPRIDLPQGEARLPARREQVSEAESGSESRGEAPIVRIHIGRIEVRAVTSPVPPAPARPVFPQPKLTLDEYLRQRNEGKR